MTHQVCGVAVGGTYCILVWFIDTGEFELLEGKRVATSRGVKSEGCTKCEAHGGHIAVRVVVHRVFASA